MTEQRKYELIGKELNGENSQEELSELYLWMSLSDENRNAYYSIKLAYEASRTKLTINNSNEVFEKMMAKVGPSTETGHSTIKLTSRETRKYPWLKIAASISILGLVAISIIFGNFSKNEDTTEIAFVQLIEKQAEKGRKLKVLLPDKSIVWLNSESKIVYPEVFTQSTRQIELVGEAFFEVQKDSLRPMQIISGDIVTTVLGTSFNISAYPEKKTLSISLVTGKIKVTSKVDNSTHTIESGHTIDYVKASKITKIYSLDVNSFAWKSGILILKDASFDEFVKNVERWYGVNAQVKGKVNDDWLLNGEFENVSLDKLMECVGYSAEFNFKIEEDMVEIIFNK